MIANEKWLTSCVGRVLDDVWTTVTVIGPNSHQLRDKTVCLDLGKPQNVPQQTQRLERADAVKNQGQKTRGDDHDVQAVEV